MGIFDDVVEGVGKIIGTAGGLAAAPIALALGASVKAVQIAIDSGCKTAAEVKEFLDDI